MSDHDPFNEPETAHPRARELMKDKLFWDCVNELAPFGSDEGHTAYYEWRDWRKENRIRPITSCLDWILMGQSTEYNSDLISDEKIKSDLKNPESAFMSESWNTYTLDTTIIATCLGQLMDEGKIDTEAKEIMDIAIARQSHPLLNMGEEHLSILRQIKVVADKAYVKFQPSNINILEQITQDTVDIKKKFRFFDWFKP